MWALGFIWHSEEKTQYTTSKWGPIICENAVVSPHWTPWMLCAKKKAHLTTLHATGLSWSYNMWKIALGNTSRPAAHHDFFSVVWGWEDDHVRYIEGETNCTCVGTVWPQPGSESISVNLLHGNCVAGVDRCVRGMSCLCSAVNPALYSISMLSSQTLDNAHTHQGVVVCFVWISLIVYVKKKKKTE